MFADGFCDLERLRDLERGWVCLWTDTNSGISVWSDPPNSLVRYAGGGRTVCEVDERGLRERGDEKVRVGRGRGVLRTVVVLASESEEEDMTDVFLLRSASVGGKVGSED